METLARSFNRLSRPPTTPEGTPNHWLFFIRHMPLLAQPEYPDHVIVIHPPSKVALPYSPADISGLSSSTDKVEIIIQRLLKSFVQISAPGGPALPGNLPSYAPVSWATEDPVLANAIGARLRQLGAAEQLCSVGVFTDADEKFIREKVWGIPHGMHAGMVMAGGDIRPGDSSMCHGCYGFATFFAPQTLSVCGACHKAYYHSRDCQKTHWQKHKPLCLASRPTNPKPCPDSTADQALDSYTYYNNVARKTPETQTFLQNLDLEYESDAPEGLVKPLRRLVMYGQDTPENMARLFGPDWEKHIGDAHQDARKVVLGE